MYYKQRFLALTCSLGPFDEHIKSLQLLDTRKVVNLHKFKITSRNTEWGIANVIWRHHDVEWRHSEAIMSWVRIHLDHRCLHQSCYFDRRVFYIHHMRWNIEAHSVCNYSVECHSCPYTDMWPISVMNQEPLANPSSSVQAVPSVDTSPISRGPHSSPSIPGPDNKLGTSGIWLHRLLGEGFELQR